MSRALRLAPPVSTGTGDASRWRTSGHDRPSRTEALSDQRLVGPGQFHEPVGDSRLLGEREQVAVIEGVNELLRSSSWACGLCQKRTMRACSIDLDDDVFSEVNDVHADLARQRRISRELASRTP